MTEGADSVGTLHFAHFAPLADTHLGFFTVFDSTFEKYMEDFTEKIGPVFDLMFKYVSDPPPTPVAKNAKAFLDYSGGMNQPAIGFYSAYPGLAVQDIRALLADAKSGNCFSHPLTAQKQTSRFRYTPEDWHGAEPPVYFSAAQTSLEKTLALLVLGCK